MAVEFQKTNVMTKERSLACLNMPEFKDKQIPFLLISHWHQVRRPYINVYPSIIEPLLNTPLDIQCKDIPRGPIDKFMIEVRTPKGCGVPPFFISRDEDLNELGMGIINIYEDSTMAMVAFSTSYQSIRDCKWEMAAIDESKKDNLLMKQDEDSKVMDKCAQLMFGMFMLANDPDYVEPFVLNRDINRNIPLNKKIDRAIRRGKYGFNFGKQMVVTPHIRKPHFAFRWKRFEPKPASLKKVLVPVKGSVIKKNKLVELQHENPNAVS